MNDRTTLPAICMAAVLFATATLPAQDSDTSRTFLVRNARVFDGTRAVERADVLVRDGVIARIGRSIPPPAGVTIIDGTGKTLLPGLIDSHTHTVGDALGPALIFGVTTELDMFSDPRAIAQLRDAPPSAATRARADIRSAGVLVTAPGGHGTQFGLPIPTLTSPDSAAAFIDARIAEGSSYIKLVYDDGRAYGGKRPSIDRATLTAAIAAARARGKLAIVHVHDRQAGREAIEAGAHGLVHLFFDSTADDAFIRLVRERRAFVIPTLTVIRSALGLPGGKALAEDSSLAPYLLPGEAMTIASTFPIPPRQARWDGVAESVRRLNAADVPILAGTDAGNPGTAHGASIHDELALLVAAGLSPAQALAAATSVPARAFGLTDRGRIARGMRADLVLVDGDPTRDIRATRAIVGVWREGAAAPRAQRLVQAAAAREAIAKLRMAPAPVGSESGLVSDFDGDSIGTTAPKARFGFGWQISTDAMRGGKSTGTIRVVGGGAGGSGNALEITGTIDGATPFGWAGAMFSPGTSMMMPANLSSKKEIVFNARGDGKRYRVMLFAQTRGFTPLTRSFDAPAEWTEVRIPLSAFGIEGFDIQSIMFLGGPAPGEFRLQIDDVRVQ